MITVKILLNDIHTVADFVNDITPLHSSFDIGHGNHAVDAKSILGIMALDLSRPLDLHCIVDKGEEKIVNGIACKYAA